MAMDVGAVTIDYTVSPPTELLERYARQLKEYDEGECWRIASDGHVFLDIEHDTMVRNAMTYVSAERLTPTEAQQIMDWVEGLPWERETVILHFGW